MTTILPTPEQVVIAGLRFFLESNKDTETGSLLATIICPADQYPRQPDGICFYVKCYGWWYVFPNYFDNKEQSNILNTAENLIDSLIKPYLPEDRVYLPHQRTLTEERIRTAYELIAKLELHQNATTSIS